LVNKNPKIINVEILTTVNTIPSFPACIAEKIFIPNPKPTTATFSKVFDTFRDCTSYGFPNICATTNPKTNAIGELIKGIKHRNAQIKKITFCVVNC